MRIHDVSRPIYSGMAVWPGDPEVRVEAAASIEGGDAVNLTMLSLGSHTGTHVDAPRHFFRDGKPIDAIDPELLIGDAFVVGLEGERVIGRQALASAGIPADTRRLLVRANSGSAGGEGDRFQTGYFYLSADAAKWLVARGIRVFGIDAPSVDGFEEVGGVNHRLLLGSGMVIIEGLDLSGVQDGAYRLCCLPLRVREGDGAPARVVLIEPDRV